MMLCAVLFLSLWCVALSFQRQRPHGSRFAGSSYLGKTAQVTPSVTSAVLSTTATLTGRTCTALHSSGSQTPNTDESLTWTSLRSILRGTNVFFVGMMGSGKTTVGKEFSKQLGYRFMDTDEIAEFMIEMPISDFFAQGKESEFRELEYKILMEMSQYTRIVLSTGGGIVERNDNWGLLHHGIVVFLDLEPEKIFSRLSANPEQIAKRPLLQGPNPLVKLQELSDKRRDKYTQADVRVQIPYEATNEQISMLVAQSIVDFIEKNPPKWLDWKKKRELQASQLSNAKFADDTNNILQ